jgi:hypothetical protein
MDGSERSWWDRFDVWTGRTPDGWWWKRAKPRSRAAMSALILLAEVALLVLLIRDPHAFFHPSNGRAWATDWAFAVLGVPMAWFAIVQLLRARRESRQRRSNW